MPARIELIIRLAGYIQQHGMIPTVREYQMTRGDLPDESTLRAQLGNWTDLWREALRVILLPGRNLDSRATNARIMDMSGRGVHAEHVAEVLGLSVDRVYARLAELRAAGLQADSTATSAGRGRPEARTRWRQALASEWPLTRETVVAWYDGHAINRATAILAHWVRQGWIQRRPDGAYDRVGGPDA